MSTATCDCSKARIEIHGPPLLRFICHCTICQRFHDSPSADMLIFRAKDVQPLDETRVNYEQLRKPPAVDRGRCADCSQPILEYLHAPLMPRLAFLPVARLDETPAIEQPALRVFYNSRVEDAEDNLPRYEGYWPSQLAIMRRLLPALLR